MRKLAAIVPVIAMLSGCGDGEDFSVEVKRPLAAVMSPYLAANIDEARPFFPGISFSRTRPSDHELLFTIPGSGGTESTIRLRFEPANNGEATVVHATVDVPPIKTTIGGVEKQLSETKVEWLLKKQIQEASDFGSRDAEHFSGHLVGIAIATNPLFLQQALGSSSGQARFQSAMANFGDPAKPTDETKANVAAAAPMDNFEAEERAEERANSEAERQQERHLEAVSEPADDTVVSEWR